MSRPHISFWQRFYYQIEKERRSGPYLNSPLRWYYCGVIRARDDTAALQKAIYVVGSSQVRIERVEIEEVP